MTEMTMEQLREELGTCIKASLAHPPIPQKGMPAYEAVMALAKSNPIAATVVMPRLLSALLDWSQSIMRIATTLGALGIALDLKPATLSQFQKELMGGANE